MFPTQSAAAGSSAAAGASAASAASAAATPPAAPPTVPLSLLRRIQLKYVALLFGIKTHMLQKSCLGQHELDQDVLAVSEMFANTTQFYGPQDRVPTEEELAAMVAAGIPVTPLYEMETMMCFQPDMIPSTFSLNGGEFKHWIADLAKKGAVNKFYFSSRFRAKLAPVGSDPVTIALKHRQSTEALTKIFQEYRAAKKQACLSAMARLILCPPNADPSVPIISKTADRQPDPERPDKAFVEANVQRAFRVKAAEKSGLSAPGSLLDGGAINNPGQHVDLGVQDGVTDAFSVRRGAKGTFKCPSTAAASTPIRLSVGSTRSCVLLLGAKKKSTGGRLKLTLDPATRAFAQQNPHAFGIFDWRAENTVESYRMIAGPFVVKSLRHRRLLAHLSNHGQAFLYGPWLHGTVDNLHVTLPACVTSPLISRIKHLRSRAKKINRNVRQTLADLKDKQYFEHVVGGARRSKKAAMQYPAHVLGQDWSLTGQWAAVDPGIRDAFVVRMGNGLVVHFGAGLAARMDTLLDEIHEVRTCVKDLRVLASKVHAKKKAVFIAEVGVPKKSSFSEQEYQDTLKYLHGAIKRGKRELKDKWRRRNNMINHFHDTVVSFLVANTKIVFLPRLDSIGMARSRRGAARANAAAGNTGGEPVTASNLRATTKRGIYALAHRRFCLRLAAAMSTRGGSVLWVSEAYTSKTCSACDVLNEKLGSKKAFVCEACTTALERDGNAALNIFRKAMAEWEQLGVPLPEFFEIPVERVSREGGFEEFLRKEAHDEDEDYMDVDE